jgi:hypothetical protein
LDGAIAYVAIRNRALLPEEVKELYRNPWQIFEPDQAVVVAAGAAAQTYQGVAALASETAVAAAGTRTQVGASALAAETTVAVAGTRTQEGAASIAAETTVTAAGTRTQSGASSVAAETTVTVAGTRTQAGASTIAGETTVTAAVTATKQGASTVLGETTLTVAGTIAGAEAGESAIAAETTVAAAATHTKAAAAAVASQTTVTVAGTRTQSGATTLLGQTTVAAAGTRTQVGASSIVTETTVAAAGTRTQAGASAILGQTTVAAAGTIPAGVQIGVIAKPPWGVELDRSHRLADGLLVHLICNDGSGGTIRDYSGRGNHAAMTNDLDPESAWVAGRDGWAVQCNGTNVWAHCGTVPGHVGSTEVTIGAWFRLRTQDGNRPICGFGGRSGGPGTSGIATSIYADGSDDLRSRVETNLGGSEVTSTAPDMDDGEWHFVAHTWSATDQLIRPYYDGVALPTGSRTGATLATDGRVFAVGHYWFNGSALDVDIPTAFLWARALAASEIRDLYHNPYVMYEWPLPAMSPVPEAGAAALAGQTAVAADGRLIQLAGPLIARVSTDYLTFVESTDQIQYGIEDGIDVRASLGLR